MTNFSAEPPRGGSTRQIFAQVSLPRDWIFVNLVGTGLAIFRCRDNTTLLRKQFRSVEKAWHYVSKSNLIKRTSKELSKTSNKGKRKKSSTSLVANKVKLFCFLFFFFFENLTSTNKKFSDIQEVNAKAKQKNKNLRI